MVLCNYLVCECFLKEDGLTSPYYYLGEVNYVRHSRSRPMDVVWKMEKRMPAEVLGEWGDCGMMEKYKFYVKYKTDNVYNV